MPNDSYAYGIVIVDEFFDMDDLVKIMNDMLTWKEQMKMLNKTESLSGNQKVGI